MDYRLETYNGSSTTSRTCWKLALAGNIENLRNIIGETAVTIMQEMVRQSNDAFISYQSNREKIQKNIWLPEIHKKACEDLKQKNILAWLDKGNKGAVGFAPVEFFERINEDQSVFFSIKKGVSPSNAIEAAFKGLTLANSLMSSQLVLYKTLLEVIGKEKFDRLFGKEAGQPIKIGYLANKELQSIHCFIDLTRAGSLRKGTMVKIEEIGAVSKIFHAICSNDIEGQQKFLWLGSSNEGESESTQFRVVPLSTEEFKIELIADLIRMPLSQVGIDFVKTYRTIPINNLALRWGEEVFSGGAFHVSEFDSSVDQLLLQKLGEELFMSNVAKVYIHGRPFIFIADKHANPRFQKELLPQLISAVNRSEKNIALFVEGMLRDPEVESVNFTYYLKNNPIQGLLFGIEEKTGETWTVCQLVESYFNLNNQLPTTSYQMHILYKLMFEKYCQDLLKELSKKISDLSSKTLIQEINALLAIFQSHGRNECMREWENIPSYNNEALWILFMKDLVQTAIGSNSFSRVERNMIQDVIDNPKNQDMFLLFARKINLERRDREQVEAVADLVCHWPQTNEVVIYDGFLHMRGLIQGLQNRSL